METYEFKLRMLNRNWEAIPVSYRLTVPYSSFNDQLAYEVAMIISKLTGVEVRWSVEGSLQGHYVNY